MLFSPTYSHLPSNRNVVMFHFGLSPWLKAEAMQQLPQSTGQPQPRGSLGGAGPGEAGISAAPEILQS